MTLGAWLILAVLFCVIFWIVQTLLGNLIMWSAGSTPRAVAYATAVVLMLAALLLILGYNDVRLGP